ncbi:MAG: hypothetical protein MUP63_03865 [Candidatus Nanohaloarchaeota archaeon QJJ-7]|nr:hypothetical protein [Candidatus Nanohaloarchaeota archaeon QJJ-7]
MDDIEEAYEEISNRNPSNEPLERNIIGEPKEAKYGSFTYVCDPDSNDGNGRIKVLYGEAEIEEPPPPNASWYGFEALALMSEGYCIRDSVSTVWDEDLDGQINSNKARYFIEELESKVREDGKLEEEDRKDLDELLWNEIYEESAAP